MNIQQLSEKSNDESQEDMGAAEDSEERSVQSQAGEPDHHYQLQENADASAGAITEADEPHHSSLEDAYVTMKLFQLFRDHPEGIYADSTIQTFNFRKESEQLALKR